MTAPVLRPIRIIGFGFLALLVLGLVASALLTLREGRRLARAQEVFAQLNEFHQVYMEVTTRVVLYPENADDGTRRVLLDHLDRLKSLSIDPDTPAAIDEVRAAVDAPDTQRAVVLQTIIAIHRVGLEEHDAQTELLRQLQRDILAQLQVEIAIPLILIAIGAALYPYARRRILRPLDEFGRQLARVGDGDLTPAPVDEAYPLLVPLHRRFNELVARLSQLEERHAAYETSLEHEIRAATGALLAQQRGLARAERLAATGELAAAMAHELRNPLAGIQMTLQNLGAEIEDTEIVERVGRVTHEVERLTRMLNQILDGARHAPEAAREVRLDELVADLLALTRHQVPGAIRLTSEIPAGLTATLPPDRLRQALLNLVLNAANAIGEAPGTVAVRAAREGERLRLEVTDDGPGFPASLLESVPRPFLSTREHGTGLGLALVRRFARDLGGEFEVRNLDPRGACVSIVLPVPA